jgi:hypothetical protein
VANQLDDSIQLFVLDGEDPVDWMLCMSATGSYFKDGHSVRLYSQSQLWIQTDLLRVGWKRTYDPDHYALFIAAWIKGNHDQENR